MLPDEVNRLGMRQIHDIRHPSIGEIDRTNRLAVTAQRRQSLVTSSKVQASIDDMSRRGI
jgi:hypothetical protein